MFSSCQVRCLRSMNSSKIEIEHIYTQHRIKKEWLYVGYKINLKKPFC